MFEQKLQSGLFSGASEKTYIDKLLARQDVEAIRELVKKPTLTRSDLLEILYLLSGVESKVLNYSEWDRYVILKFFVWIREFCKIAELLYDYNDKLEKKEKEGKMILSSETKELLDNNTRLIQHNIKFLVDLYLNIGRSSLSIKGMGFMEILNNKYEISYPSGNSNMVQAPQQGGGILNIRK